MGRNELTVMRKVGECGFGLIEGLIAAAVVAIGFVGILHVATVASQTLLFASSQDKLTMMTIMMLEEIAQDTANLEKYTNVNLITPTPPAGLHPRGREKSIRWRRRFESYCGAKLAISKCLSRAQVAVETKCKNSAHQLVSCGNPPNTAYQQIRVLTVTLETIKGPKGKLNATVARTFNVS